MSNKVEVSDWQLQSFVKKLENLLTNGWEVDDTSVAYYNGLKFCVSLVKSEALLAKEQDAQNLLDSPEVNVDAVSDVDTPSEAPKTSDSSDVVDTEVVVDQEEVKTPVTANKPPSRATSKSKTA